jgi:hypothetical protein
MGMNERRGEERSGELRGWMRDAKIYGLRKEGWFNG